jgi:hypothetical protein
MHSLLPMSNVATTPLSSEELKTAGLILANCCSVQNTGRGDMQAGQVNAAVACTWEGSDTHVLEYLRCV